MSIFLFLGKTFFIWACLFIVGFAFGDGSEVPDDPVFDCLYDLTYKGLECYVSSYFRCCFVIPKYFRTSFENFYVCLFCFCFKRVESRLKAQIHCWSIMHQVAVTGLKKWLESASQSSLNNFSLRARENIYSGQEKLFNLSIMPNNGLWWKIINIANKS